MQGWPLCSEHAGFLSITHLLTLVGDLQLVNQTMAKFLPGWHLCTSGHDHCQMHSRLGSVMESPSGRRLHDISRAQECTAC